MFNKNLETGFEIIKNKGLVFCDNCKYKRTYDECYQVTKFILHVDCANENNIIRTNKALKIKTEYQSVEIVNKNNDCKYYEKKIYFWQKEGFVLKILVCSIIPLMGILFAILKCSGGE